MWPYQRELMQEWLGGCAMLDQKMWFLLWNVGMGCNWTPLRNIWKETIAVSSWSSKYQTFEVGGSFVRGKPMKIKGEVIKWDVKDWKISKELAKDRNVW